MGILCLLKIITITSSSKIFLPCCKQKFREIDFTSFFLININENSVKWNFFFHFTSFFLMKFFFCARYEREMCVRGNEFCVRVCFYIFSIEKCKHTSLYGTEIYKLLDCT